MRILVTGGAGYVGSVSVEALLEAGHEVTVLDDLSTGHADAVPTAPRLEVGSYADAAELGRAPRAGRIEAILHCAARSLVGESARAIRPATTARTSPAASPCSRLPGRPASGGSSSARRRPSTAIPDETPITEDAPLRPINPTARRSARSRAPRWYGSAYGLRSRQPSLLQRRRGQRAERRGPRPGDAPHPERPPGGRRTGAPSRSSATTTRRPTGPASATTSTSPTSPTPTSSPSRRPRRTTQRTARAARLQPRQRRRVQRPRRSWPRRRRSSAGPSRTRSGARRAGDPPVLVASSERAAEVLGWEAAATVARGDDRLGVGVAPAQPQGISGTAGRLVSAARAALTSGARRSRRRLGDSSGSSPEPPSGRSRPQQPHPDEHRHRAGSARRAGRRRRRASSRNSRIVTPYSSWPMTCEPLPTSPYSPKNSPSRSGGESRTMNTRSATWTPPRPLPRIAAGEQEQRRSRPAPSMPSETAPSDEPDRPRRQHDHQRPLRPRAGRRAGPSRSWRRRRRRSAPGGRACVCGRVRPFASTATTLITTMIVLTASE